MFTFSSVSNMMVTKIFIVHTHVNVVTTIYIRNIFLIKAYKKVTSIGISEVISCKFNVNKIQNYRIQNYRQR